MSQTKKQLWTYSAPSATEYYLRTEQLCVVSLQQTLDEESLFDEDFNEPLT